MLLDQIFLWYSHNVKSFESTRLIYEHFLSLLLAVVSLDRLSKLELTAIFFQTKIQNHFNYYI